MQLKRHKTGLKIRQSGIYTVIHSQHRLPHEVTLLKGETFPRCSKCGAIVEFELVKAAPEINGAGGFRIVLYELPAEEVEEQAASGRADAEIA